VKLLFATMAGWLGMALLPTALPAQVYQGMPPEGMMVSPYAASYTMQGPMSEYPGYTPYGPIEVPSVENFRTELGHYAGAFKGATCAGDDCQHCCPNHCLSGCCLHRSSIFAEYLYWDVGGIDMPYAVPQDGIGGIGTVPVEEVATAGFDPDTGFRFGFNVALDCCSSVGATVTWLETNTTSSLVVDAPSVVQPLVMFPGTFNAGFTAQAAAAGYSFELQMIDLDYRAILLQGAGYHVNYLAGGRYAHIDQTFSAIFPFAPPDGTSLVDTDINFDGAGIRVGLEGERRLWAKTGLLLYGKTAASLLAGHFRASYVQSNQFNGTEALSNWDETRVVPIGEIELGIGWSCRHDFLRISAGYHFSCWHNIVTTPDWVNGVQNLGFTDVGQDEHDSITFDGLVARLELRL
jgi:hypothetical protein